MNLSVYGKVKIYGGKLTLANPDFEVLEEEDTGARLVAAAMGMAVCPPTRETVPAAERIHTGRMS